MQRVLKKINNNAKDFNQKILENFASVISKSFSKMKMISILKSEDITKIDESKTEEEILYNLFSDINNGLIKSKKKDKSGIHVTYNERKIKSIVTAFLHPLNNEADEEKVKDLQQKIELILSYTNLALIRDENIFYITNQENLEEENMWREQNGREKITTNKYNPINIKEKTKVVFIAKETESRSSENTLTIKYQTGLFAYKSDENLYFRDKIIEGLETREFKILLSLMKNAPSLVTYDTLTAEASSKGDSISKENLQKYVSPLHQKLKAILKKEDKKFSGKIITATSKTGYRLESIKIQDFFTKKQ